VRFQVKVGINSGGNCWDSPLNIRCGSVLLCCPRCSESPTARTEQSHVETMAVERWTSRSLGLFRKPELPGHRFHLCISALGIVPRVVQLVIGDAGQPCALVPEVDSTGAVRITAASQEGHVQFAPKLYS